MQTTKDTKNTKRPEWFRPWWKSRVFGVGVLGLILLAFLQLFSRYWLATLYDVGWNNPGLQGMVRDGHIWLFVSVDGDRGMVLDRSRIAIAGAVGGRVDYSNTEVLSTVGYFNALYEVNHREANMPQLHMDLRLRTLRTLVFQSPILILIMIYTIAWLSSLVWWQRRKARFLR